VLDNCKCNQNVKIEISDPPISDDIYPHVFSYIFYNQIRNQYIVHALKLNNINNIIHHIINSNHSSIIHIVMD